MKLTRDLRSNIFPKHVIYKSVYITKLFHKLFLHFPSGPPASFGVTFRLTSSQFLPHSVSPASWFCENKRIHRLPNSVRLGITKWLPTLSRVWEKQTTLNVFGNINRIRFNAAWFTLAPSVMAAIRESPSHRTQDLNTGWAREQASCHSLTWHKYRFWSVVVRYSSPYRQNGPGSRSPHPVSRCHQKWQIRSLLILHGEFLI